MKRITTILLTVALSLVAGLCLAAEFTPPPKVSAPSALVTMLLNTVFPVAGSLVLGIFSIFLQRLSAKYKIDALTQKDNFATKLAAQGIALAEERAAQLLGSKLQLTGSQKLDIAIAHICQAIPGISNERAKAIVEATLAQIPGVGATGNSTYSLDPYVFLNNMADQPVKSVSDSAATA